MKFPLARKGASTDARKGGVHRWQHPTTRHDSPEVSPCPEGGVHRWGRDVHKRYLIHVAGHNLGLLMRLLIGAGTPKEAVARGWCVLILLPTSDGAADAAILIVLVAHSAIP